MFFEFHRSTWSPVFQSFYILVLFGVMGMFAFAQTPSPTPVLDLAVVPSTDPMPVQPPFTAPVKPMPSIERVGVETSTQLSLTVEQAVEMALKNNKDIEVSRNDYRISEFGIRAARGLYDPLVTSEGYYESLAIPTASLIGGAVNGAVTQTRTFGSVGVTGFSPYQGGSYSALFNSSRTTTSNTNSLLNPQFPSSFTATYVQPLLRNRKFDNNRRQIEIAKKNQELSDVQLQLKAIDVISNVEQAYWNLVFALRVLQVEQESLKQAKDQLESNKRLVARGVLAPIELVAANSQIANFEQSLFVAQDAVTRAENNLKTQVLPDRSAPEWSRPLMPVSPVELPTPRISLEVAVAEALKNRFEITELQKGAEINEIDQRYYRNLMKPQIDLVGTYTTQGLAGIETAAAINPATGLSRVPGNLVGSYPNSLLNLLQQDYPTYRVGVTISLPWGNRIAKANLGSKLVEAERIQNLRLQTEQAIEAEVRNALQSMRSIESRLASAVDARVAAEDLYESEQRLFRAGTSTFYVVTQRQTDLARARNQELQARTALNRAISDFQKAIGATLTSNNVTVSK
ncbi:MAG TPA: TolC family protein [Pyrinomonadaceae bacterium]|nr:TolC family protein [Acidobacteriota bacterium]HQZ95734.1 TolC family protein [Pyrinomonadaceae bacterium]